MKRSIDETVVSVYAYFIEFIAIRQLLYIYFLNNIFFDSKTEFYLESIILRYSKGLLCPLEEKDLFAFL